MAKGCCGSSGIMPVINEGVDAQGRDTISVTGTGTVTDPFVVSFIGLTSDPDPVQFVTTTVTFETDGLHIKAAVDQVNSSLHDIGDVHAPSPPDGYVLAWDNTNRWWHPISPTTIASGTNTTGAAITGDGSAGDPLDVLLASGSGLAGDSPGLRLADSTWTALVQHFADSTARSAMTPAPVLGTMSTLNDNPGMVDWWDGTAWQPLLWLAAVQGTEYLALSGPYDGSPITTFVKQLTDTTDSSGLVTLLADADLTGFAGVLSVTIQPVLDSSYTTGSATWTIHLDAAASSTEVIGVAFATDATGEWASQPVTAIVTALLY